MATESRAMTSHAAGSGIVAGSPTAAIDGFKILDVYTGGVSEEAPRVEALATISAGYRAKSRGDRPGLPERSIDGTIHLHDGGERAPGLKRALAQFGNKKLTIAFPFDDPARFIHCRFMRYSATELLAFGDETHLMVLIPGSGYRRIDAGTEAYTGEVTRCKVSVSVYFCLADWGDDGPEIVFPDGVGAYYRLRFTSRHSLRSILAGLRSIGQFTRGRVAGVPFDLSIDYRDVAGPDGKKRTVPVWAIAAKPPGGKRLTSRNFSETMQFALDQGAALMLPAPPEPTLDAALGETPIDDMDDAIIEGVVVGEPSDREITLIQLGGRCDEARWRAMFFSAVGGSDFDGDESPARAAWLRDYTNGRTDSLAELLHWSTEKEAQAMVLAADEELKRRRAAREERGEPPPTRTASPKRTYRELFPDDEEGGAVVANKVGGPDHEHPLSDRMQARRIVEADGRVTKDNAGDYESTPPEPDSPPEPANGSEVQAVAGEVVNEPPSPFKYANVSERYKACAAYDELVKLAAQHGYPYAAKVQAKAAKDLYDHELEGSIRVLGKWAAGLVSEGPNDAA